MRFKTVTFALILSSFFVGNVLAQGIDFDRLPQELEPKYEMPSPDSLTDFKEYVKERIPLGKLLLPKMNPMNVSLWITNSMDWYIQFRVGQSRKVRGYIYFRLEDGCAKFKGMWVMPSLRKKGFSKAMFRYFAMFAAHYKLSLGTTKIYKPLFAKILHGFFFSPRELSDDDECYNVAYLDLDPNNKGLHVYPEGFELNEKLVKSQKMLVLKEKPVGPDVQEVCVNTSFLLQKENENAFWERMKDIPGKYILYGTA